VVDPSTMRIPNAADEQQLPDVLGKAHGAGEKRNRGGRSNHHQLLPTSICNRTPNWRQSGRNKEIGARNYARPNIDVLDIFNAQLLDEQRQKGT